MTPRGLIEPIHDFDTIKFAFNRWRAEKAPHLTRDEAVRFALGEWLTWEGCLPPCVSRKSGTRLRRQTLLPAEWE